MAYGRKPQEDIFLGFCSSRRPRRGLTQQNKGKAKEGARK